MFGEPSDVDGECNARLFLADNYGDNHATIRCQLAPGHEELHQEKCRNGTVTITWATDERKRCDHGCGQWRHDHRAEAVVCPLDATDHEYSDCAYCNPGETGAECAECGKTYYYEEGHKRDCPGRPFACTDCGENGVGVHACPRILDVSLIDLVAGPKETI